MTETDKTPKRQSVGVLSRGSELSFSDETVLSCSSDRRFGQPARTRRHRRAELPSPLRPSPRGTARLATDEPDLPEQDLVARLRAFEDSMIAMIEETQRLYVQFGSDAREEEQAQAAHGQGQGQHQHQHQHQYRHEAEDRGCPRQPGNSFSYRDEDREDQQPEHLNNFPTLKEFLLAPQAASAKAVPVPKGLNVPHSHQPPPKKTKFVPLEEQRYTPSISGKRRHWDVRAGSGDDVFGR